MKDREDYSGILKSVRSSLGVLELDKNSQLYRDVISICDYFDNPTFRIAVFGPFNYGKSTLLNALMGNRALPIDIIPTTGAAIAVKYGEELRTRITMSDGTEINELGTDVLKQFAILDGDRRMRGDVASVEVTCPHPFLQNGVELLDLPGTNDREAQDDLVRDKLLTADLIVQVLDARQLMTLVEREKLRDWLLDRGIKTIVFVVNFVNLLEPEDQKEVQNRLRFVAESFRADLPPGISNLYRVDALPALRARLKGDAAAAQTTGISSFESALQSISAFQQEKRGDTRLPRVNAIAMQIKQALQVKSSAIATELETAQSKHQAKIDIQQRAETLIKQGFAASIAELRNWLQEPKLIERYHSEVASALQNNQFSSWQNGAFRQAIADLQEAVVKWIIQACEFFDRPQPERLLITFPSPPDVLLPEKPKVSDSGSSNAEKAVLATGIGWLLGGPVGAAVGAGASYLLSRDSEDDKQEPSQISYENQVAQAYAKAAYDYLNRFSAQAISKLNSYEEEAKKVIKFQVPKEPLEVTEKCHRLSLLNACLDNLNAELG
ncbi:dynamin family protein [Microcoleus sp. FACHB-831]|uniref:dynamin family protein n=1 Tax=Microcoleus sp. FACHB-831 TaxID=2692827 RepID=UPI001685FD91|nr:dynamin family protein [Microcoleus sp. FACHB-831]MBD1922656.1 dynamin family protein [Microcoleus sp. FACHB-831]